AAPKTSPCSSCPISNSQRSWSKRRSRTNFANCPAIIRGATGTSKCNTSWKSLRKSCACRRRPLHQSPRGRPVLNFAMQIAREAGSLLVQRLGVAKITNKGDIDLVTEADLASENLIIERIRSYYPQHGILAEESGEAVLVGGKRSDWKWIIDPLDGTTNYA